MTTYEGGCHCGTVRFKVVLPRPIPFLTDCDCSICTKKGVLHCPAEVEQFTLTDGEGTLPVVSIPQRNGQTLVLRALAVFTSMAGRGTIRTV